MTNATFSSPDKFRLAFEKGLERLLNDNDELGVAILVLANATFDKNIWRHLQATLRQRLDYLAKQLIRGSKAGQMDKANDDLVVFEQLKTIGWEKLKNVIFRQLGPWELQFNHLRSFMPTRTRGDLVSGISAPFDHNSFHFDKPYLHKEIFWQGKLRGRQIALYYNKFPFVELHCLMVPEPKVRMPQFLSKEENEYLWEVTRFLGKNLPGTGFGYNSYGAYASVNHLHFQMFMRENPLPVTDPKWSHNGGDRSYPVACIRYESAAESWNLIRDFHKTETSYNLIYLPDRLYCLPRARQGSYTHSNWTRGFAWHELGGGFTTSNLMLFESLTEADLTRELSLLQNFKVTFDQ